MKTVDNFDPYLGRLTVALTMIMRIKFTGLPDINDVMNFCSEKDPNHDVKYNKKYFKIRINEEEMNLFESYKKNNNASNCTVNMSKS